MKARKNLVRVRTLLVVFVIVSLGYAYLQVGLLPGKLKVQAIQHIEKILGRKVAFKRVVYIPFMGIIIDELSVALPTQDMSFKTRSLKLQVPLIALFKDKKIVVSEAHLEEPELGIALTDSPPAESVSPLPAPVLEFLENGVDVFLPDNVYLQKISVRNGTLEFRQKTAQGYRHAETLRKFNLKADFGRRPRVPFRGSCTLGRKNTEAEIRWKGFWDMAKSRHELTVDGHTYEVPDWFKQKTSGSKLRLGEFSSDFKVELVYEKNHPFQFRIEASNAEGDIGWDRWQLLGSFKTEARGVFDPQTKKTHISDGRLTFQDTRVRGLPQPLDEVRIQKSAVRYHEGLVAFENLETVWRDHPLVVSGEARIGNPTTYEIRINDRVKDLGLFVPFIPQAVKEKLGKDFFVGPVAFEAKFSGVSGDSAASRKWIRIRLDRSQVRLPAWKQDFKDVSGKIEFDGKKVQWDKLRLDLLGKPLSLSGVWTLGDEGVSQIHAEYPLANVKAEIRPTPEGWDIDELRIFNGSSVIQLTGFVIGKTNPDVRLAGKASLNLDELKNRIKGQWKGFDLLKPSGRLYADLRFSLPLKNKSLTKGTINVAPSDLKLYDKLSFKSLMCDIAVDEGRFAVTYGKATVSGGELRFSGSLGPGTRRENPIALSLNLLGMDLTTLSKDIGMKGKQLAGFLNFDLNLKGNARDKRSFEGQGRFQVKNGLLWSTPLFHELSNLVFVRIEGMDDVVFESAEGTFFFLNGSLITEDAVLSSLPINVWISGAVGFDMGLDLMLESRFTDEVIRQSRELGGMASVMVNYAEGKITRYHVTGNLLKPKFEKL